MHLPLNRLKTHHFYYGCHTYEKEGKVSGNCAGHDGSETTKIEVRSYSLPSLRNRFSIKGSMN